jgi:chromosome segregation ATPase
MICRPPLVAAQQAQILLYRLQGQEAIVARASQRLDDARATLAEVQSNRTKLTSNIKKYEEASQTENSSTDRKQIEELLPQLKARLAALENEEQQWQTSEIEAEDQVRTERAKLGELQVQLDRLEKILEGSGQQSATNPH